MKFLPVALAAIAIVACGEATSAPEAGQATDQAVGPVESRESAASRGRGFLQRPAAEPAPVPPATARDASDPRDAPRMIIRTGQASVEVDSLEPAVAALRALVQRLGGFVASSSFQLGRDQMRSATLELKVPADRFEQLVADLEPIGAVDYVNVSAQDVGREYVDLRARLANAERLEDRLVELLATRTGKLEDVLAVERELARVREEIERHQARLRYLEHQTALSTLSATLHEPPPLVGHPGSSVIGGAFQQAWRNFVALIAGVIAASGIVLPLAVATGAGVFLWRHARRYTSDRRAPG